MHTLNNTQTLEIEASKYFVLSFGISIIHCLQLKFDIALCNITRNNCTKLYVI